MTKAPSNKKIYWLDYECKPGDKVKWETMGGESFEGILISMDEDYVATVKLANGKIVTYQC